MLGKPLDFLCHSLLISPQANVLYYGVRVH
jgi:hypothetical protein